METTRISEISRALIQLAWHFSSNGLNEPCCENISMSEFIALDKISLTNNCSIQEVGIPLHFTKSGATRMVNRLEKKGYVYRAKDLNDARFCCVMLTEKGRKILGIAHAEYMKQLQNLLQQMPKSEANQALQVITSMAHALKE